MKENVFHGSIVVGLKEIKPNELTQKDFLCVYATIYKELAAIFAITTFGGSYAISLCQNNKNGKFIIVERIPNWIGKINSKFSIYTLLGNDFYYFDKDNWKNLEVRSDKVQKVIEEESFDSAKDMLDYFIKLNKIEYYKYPYRPDFIPQDDSDLIITTMNIWKMGNEDAFEILIKYHPNLKIKVKEFLNTNNISSVI